MNQDEEEAIILSKLLSPKLKWEFRDVNSVKSSVQNEDGRRKTRRKAKKKERISETSVNFYQTARWIPECSHIHTRRHENSKPYLKLSHGCFPSYPCQFILYR
jgi:hypothetical protein